MNRKALFALANSFMTFMLLTGISCKSVFSGGTGGLVVDAESTSVPKAGIANVDVYAYMSKSDRDADFSAWTEGSIFTPASDYYGHTNTDGDGAFTISKLVWQEDKPDFGKDADYTSVYLIFYHENYGLTKSESVIISDSVSDTVYTELTAVRKSTVLNMTFEDVSSGAATDKAVYVKVSVPQTTSTNTSAAAKLYEATITGSGSLTISYPRWQSAEARSGGIETEPAVTISYCQSEDQITWRGCYNADNDAGDYSFRADESGLTSITKTIKNPSYSVTLYGKSSQLSVPSIGGQYKSADSEADDGLKVCLFLKDSDGAYSVNLGETSTAAQAVGTTGTEKHGNFSGLGSSYYWTDTTYSEKYSTADLKVVVYAADGSEAASKEVTVRSDNSSYNVQLP
ncbi:MAG: hypothetical protein K5681_07105 [Treponema sp.]|nr:hypothetical protein [Treponema sp.]